MPSKPSRLATVLGLQDAGAQGGVDVHVDVRPLERVTKTAKPTRAVVRKHAWASSKRGGMASQASKRLKPYDQSFEYLASRLRVNIVDMDHPCVAALSPCQLDVLRCVATRQNVFVTGRAGSGKSMVIDALYQALRAAKTNVALTAASGLAAGQINGITLHSLCCMGINDTPTMEVCIRNAKARHGDVLCTLEVLVIDEVSMLSAETLTKAFGVITGVRGSLPLIVLVGDFLQLPPSGRKETHALESDIWRSLHLQVVMLTTAFRQRDEAFVRLLDEARVGTLSDASIRELEARVGVSFTGDVRPTTLTPLRSLAEATNAKELAALSTPKLTFRGRVMAATFDTATATWVVVPGCGSVPPKQQHVDKSRPAPPAFPALDGADVLLSAADISAWYEASALVTNCRQATVITLAVGAQVLFTANTRPPTISNGTRGVVRGFDGPSNNPLVELVSGEVVTVTPFTCTARARAPAVHTYVYEQLPLQLGWAMTIHKSQGMSINRVELDLGDAIFSEGQAYVALSRATSFSGVALIAFSKSAVKATDRIVAWYRVQQARLTAAVDDEAAISNEADVTES